MAFLEWTERSTADPTHRLLSPLTPLSSTPTLLPTILVVDDSINVRQFLAVTLEKSGYRVKQAKDGQDALEQLQTQDSEV